MKQARLSPSNHKSVLDSSLTIVNIVLLLIFFFLTTGSMIGAKDFYVELPETAELPLDILPKPLLIVTEDGQMQLDGVSIEVGTLNDHLIDFPVLHILADRDQKAVALLDVLATENLVAVEIKLVTIHRKDSTAEALP
jgi:biopolymer transport protein ExbD